MITFQDALYNFTTVYGMDALQYQLQLTEQQGTLNEVVRCNKVARWSKIVHGDPKIANIEIIDNLTRVNVDTKTVYMVAASRPDFTFGLKDKYN